MPRSKKKILDYADAQMQRALEEVAHGVAVATAARRNGVPRVTLLYKTKGKTPLARKMGPERAFTMDEEKILVKWIIMVGKMGFPVTNEDLLNSVGQLAKDLGRQVCFKNSQPTSGWIQRFRRRHPEISSRTAQNLTSTRAAIKKEHIHNWFREVHEYLVTSGLEGMLSDPKRVFNGDETAFFLNLKAGKVLARKGQKTVYQKVNPDEKECLTVLVTANAGGMLVPPMVLFKYDRLPRDIAESIPSEFGIGRSENGWMTSATFYEYITNIFYKWLIQENIELPVTLFIDGHASHITYHTSKFCEENGIVLVALYPNATHLMQPMDVVVFRTLKDGWKQAIHEWRCKNLDNPFLKKKHFCPLLKEVLEKRVTKEVVSNGFRKSGWKTYYHKKEQAKLEQEKCKKERAELREKKKYEKERLQQLKQEEKKKKSSLIKKKKNKLLEDSSDSEEEEWVESGSSGDDISILGDVSFFENITNREDHPSVSSEAISSNPYGKGDYILPEFPGKKKAYKYICLILQNFNDEEFEVMGLKSCNELKTLFKLDEQDVSTIYQRQILRKLPQPSIGGSGDRVKYGFENVEVDG